MREVYYQSVGNPVQCDRLPKTRPVLEFTSPPADGAARVRQLLGLVTMASLLVMLMLLTWRPPGWSWLEPFDLALALPVVAISVSYAAFYRRADSLGHPVTLIAVALLAINHRMPWGGQVLLAGGVAGVLTYGLGLHGIHIHTASPVPRTAAQSIRKQLRHQLLLLAGIALLLTVATVWTGAMLFQLALLALPITVALVSASGKDSQPRWRVLVTCFVSWLTYQPPRLPGVMQSPLGNVQQRVSITLLAVLLVAVVLVRMPNSPLDQLITFGAERQQTVIELLDARGAADFERFRFAGFIRVLSILFTLLLPTTLPWLLALSLTAPVVLEAAGRSRESLSDNPVQAVMADMRRSPDLTERGSIYLGRVAADGSPVQVPREVFTEHAHGLGDSGGGKTSLFLCPLIEQLGMTGECSVIVIDNKADTLELLASLQAVAEGLRREQGRVVPLKVFSNQANKASFAFNPMTQPFWSNFDLFTRTDIICGANGLSYGSDYGEGYYSSANAAVLYHTLKTFPHISTFEELAECIQEVTISASKRELHPEIRKAGVHVMEVMKRLAACQPLNVTSATERDPLVLEQAIDFTKVFAEPQLHYFHLSATLSPSGAPEIARLVAYMLLAAATQTKRRVRVFLVIDEFQRMVASNLEYMLQLARSMGVGIILANQSMEDLKHSTTNLIPAIEANCRLRQWFSVSSTDDQERLIKGSGLTVDYNLGLTVSKSSDGKQSVSQSQSETVVPRITLNDIALTNDHRFRSFLHLKRGAGYAQYGGMPVVIETGFHISEQEYRRRRALAWPKLPGAFTPESRPKSDPVIKLPDPVAGPKFPDWTEEEIEEEQGAPDGQVSTDIEQIFDAFRQTLPGDQPPRRPS